MLLYFFHLTAFFLCFLIAPLVAYFSFTFKKRLNKLIFSWKKSHHVLITISFFVVNFLLFIGAVFFFANYFGNIQGFNLIQFDEETDFYLAFDFTLILIANFVIYLSSINYFTQFISTEGIYFQNIEPKKFSIEEKLLKWDQIQDYYVHSDYPSTEFKFLFLENNKQYSLTLKVPFYVLPKFKQLLENKMNEVLIKKYNKKYPKQSLTSLEETTYD